MTDAHRERVRLRFVEIASEALRSSIRDTLQRAFDTATGFDVKEAAEGFWGIAGIDETELMAKIDVLVRYEYEAAAQPLTHALEAGEGK